MWTLWILIATVFFSGILAALSHGLRDILGWRFLPEILFGDSDDPLEIGLIPTLLLRMAIFSALWEFLLLVSEIVKHLNQNLLFVLTVGAALALVYTGLVVVTERIIGGTLGKHTKEIIGGSALGVFALNVLGMFAGWEALQIYDSTTWIVTMFIFALAGTVTGGIIVLLHGLAVTIRQSIFLSLSSFLISSRFITQICGYCLRYTDRFLATYRKGKRFCEHCRQEVEQSDDPGKVIVTFGKISVSQQGRVFVLADPEVEHKDQPIDVTEVYIDTATCHPRAIERFITYSMNHPPARGLRSVTVLYQGDPEKIGSNLRNALRNNFGALLISLEKR